MLLFLACVGATAVQARSTTLIDFEIKDQFDQVYRQADYEGRILYVIGSDAKGSSFNGEWGRAIYEALKGEEGFEDVVSLPLADLRAVPFFLKGTIRKKFPQEKDRWVLMDWKGVFPKAYGFERRSMNIVVFAADGRLVHQAHGRELDKGVLDGIVTAIRDLLAAGGS
jgi:hypothetical protein